MEEFTYEGMRYLVQYPKDYKQGEKYPILFFYHGAGTRGSDIEKLKNNVFFTYTAQLESFPFIVVAPQCHKNTWFDLFETLKSLACFIADSDFADKDRIYAIGASMGGYATWQMAMSMPELFAAIVPICGGGMYWNTARLKNMPIWAFHGELDTTVLVEETKKMVESVNKRGGHAKMTLYPENKHDSWSDTYQNQEVFDWMLSHRKGETLLDKDAFSDSKTYG